MNNINSFIDRLVKRLGEYYGSDYCVTSTEVNKNNGTLKHAVLIRKKNEKITPSIYIDELYERYSDGETFSEIIANIISIRDMHDCNSEFDPSLLEKYDNVRDKLRIKLINKEYNRLILADCPHVPFADMEIVFLITVEDKTIGKGEILIHNDLFNKWNISIDRLYADAIENSMFRYAPNMMDIFDMLIETFEKNHGRYGCENQEEIQEFLDNLKIFKDDARKIQVLSSSDKTYGASVMVYPNMLKQIGDTLGHDYYVIPSSIHEVIIIAENNIEEGSSYTSMVKEVNCTQLSPEEVLSEHAYRYHRSTNWLEPIYSESLVAV